MLRYVDGMRRVGKILQVIGLTAPPVAIIMQLMPNPRGGPLISQAFMLGSLICAVCFFGIGRIIEGYAR